MRQSEVTLSRAAARVVDLLNREAREEFVRAVMLSTSISGVALPYRRWITDPESIPESARRRLLWAGEQEQRI